jgi:hypothetical protein
MNGERQLALDAQRRNRELQEKHRADLHSAEVLSANESLLVEYETKMAELSAKNVFFFLKIC